MDRADVYSSTFAGAGAEAPQEQHVVGSMVLPPSPDPQVVAFTLQSDESRIREGTWEIRGGKGAARGDARVALVEGAPKDAPSTGYTTSFAREQVVEPGGSCLPRQNRLTTQPHVELLPKYMRDTLGVPRGGLPVAVNALLDTRSGVRSISENLARRLQREAHQSVIEVCQGHERVQAFFE